MIDELIDWMATGVGAEHLPDSQLAERDVEARYGLSKLIIRIDDPELIDEFIRIDWQRYKSVATALQQRGISEAIALQQGCKGHATLLQHWQLI